MKSSHLVLCVFQLKRFLCDLVAVMLNFTLMVVVLWSERTGGMWVGNECMSNDWVQMLLFYGDVINLVFLLFSFPYSYMCGMWIWTRRIFWPGIVYDMRVCLEVQLMVSASTSMWLRCLVCRLLLTSHLRGLDWFRNLCWRLYPSLGCSFGLGIDSGSSGGLWDMPSFFRFYCPDYMGINHWLDKCVWHVYFCGFSTQLGSLVLVLWC